MNTEQRIYQWLLYTLWNSTTKKNEIKNATTLSNGMFAIIGFCKPDGYSIDAC